MNFYPNSDGPAMISILKLDFLEKKREIGGYARRSINDFSVNVCYGVQAPMTRNKCMQH
jgi:hypothetical protein